MKTSYNDTFVCPYVSYSHLMSILPFVFFFTADLNIHMWSGLMHHTGAVEEC